MGYLELFIGPQDKTSHTYGKSVEKSIALQNSVGLTHLGSPVQVYMWPFDSVRSPVHRYI